MNNFTFFIAGSIVGAYIAQNYNIPNLDKMCTRVIKNIKELEKKDD